MSKNVRIFKFFFIKHIQFLILSLFIIGGLSMVGELINIELFAVMTAIICGLYMCNYTYSRNMIDFYYSLPLKRTTLFTIKAFVGYSYLAIVFVIVSIVGYVINDFSISKIMLLLLLVHSSYCLTLWLCSICNNRIDAIALSFVIPLLFFVGLYVCSLHYTFFTNNNYSMNEFINMVFNATTMFMSSLLFFYSAIKIVQQKAIEWIGGPLVFPRFYLILKIIATYIYLLYATAVFAVYPSKTLFAFIVSHKSYILLGLIIYLIGTIIETKKIDKIFKHIITYVLFVVSYLLIYSLLILICNPPFITGGI